MNIHNPIIIIDEDQDDLRLLSDAHKELAIKNPLRIRKSLVGLPLSRFCIILIEDEV